MIVKIQNVNFFSFRVEMDTFLMTQTTILIAVEKITDDSHSKLASLLNLDPESLAILPEFYCD